MATRRGFGRLRERASGRWQAGYVGPDAAMHYAPETFTAKADAEAWLNSERKLIEADVDPSDPRSWTAPAERLNVRRMKGVTLNEFADAWIENHRPRGNAPIKPRTKAHYRKMLDKRILPELGHLEVRKLTAEHVKAWHKDAQELKPPTYTAHAYALLRTLMNSAVDDKLIAASTTCRTVCNSRCSLPAGVRCGSGRLPNFAAQTLT